MRANDTIRKALLASAAGRIAWGAFALTAPKTNTKLAGIGAAPSGEVVYLIRVFGSRALAIGAGYLLSDEHAKARWRLLSLLVDASDTAAGIGHLVRGDVRRSSAAGLAAITGVYAVLDVAGVLADRQATRSAPDRAGH